MLRNLAVLVFADTAALAEAAQAAARDPAFSKIRVEVRQGGMAEAKAWLGAHRSPDVLIVGDPVDGDLWSRLETLAETVEPACKVIVAGRRDSIALYRDLTARGIADYIGGAVTGQDLVAAIRRLFVAEDNLPKGKLVVVTGASGGAGSSTVAAITADVLWKRLGDAVLLDLDLHMGTAALALGLEIRDPVADALANTGLDVAMLERFIVRDRGARVLSTHGSLRGTPSFDVESIERLVAIARSVAKVVVVDLPKGWSETHQRLMALADEIAIVTAPDLASLRNSRMILDELGGRTDAPRPKVVLNKAGFARSKEYADADFKEALGSALAAVIPWDPSPLMAAVVDGKPVSEAGGKAAAGMRAFAKTLIASKESVAGQAKAASAPVSFKGLFARFA